MSQIMSPNRYVGRRSPIRLIVLHTMEVPESDPNVAEAVGHAFSDPSRKASAQVGVDVDSECRYVADTDTAWAAPGVNNDGLHLEMAGRASQVSARWQDSDSRKIVERAAFRTAAWCRQYGIPSRHLRDAGLKAGASGIIDHHAATRVYPGPGRNHTDVGQYFPWDAFISRVQAMIGGAVAPPQKKPVVPPSTRIKLTVDGDFGPRSRARLQQWAGLVPDSNLLTKFDWVAVQHKLGNLSADGDPGDKTWRRIQTITGAKVDGSPGPDTYRHMQSYLNSH